MTIRHVRRHEGPSLPDLTSASMEGPRHALLFSLHKQLTFTGENLGITKTYKHKGKKPNRSQAHRLEINTVGVWGLLL